MPTPLSIFNHVRNEARTLAKSLASIRPIADELVVVDTGSTDETIAIARRYADRVVEWTWRDDFAAASRYAASLCTHRFACKWDGDWWLRESIESIQTLKQAGLKAGSVYHFLWINKFDPETLTPIIRNTRQFIYDRFSYEWVSPIHTHLAPKQGQSLQTITDLSITIYDDKEPLAKQHRYTQTQQLLAHHYAHAFGAERTRLAKYAVLSAFHLEDYEALSFGLRSTDESTVS